MSPPSGGASRLSPLSSSEGRLRVSVSAAAPTRSSATPWGNGTPRPSGPGAERPLAAPSRTAPCSPPAAPRSPGAAPRWGPDGDPSGTRPAAGLRRKRRGGGPGRSFCFVHQPRRVWKQGGGCAEPQSGVSVPDAAGSHRRPRVCASLREGSFIASVTLKIVKASLRVLLLFHLVLGMEHF